MYRAGAIRWFDKFDQDYCVVEPGNTMYSTGLMIAQEYWDPKTESWKPIDPPETSEIKNAG